MSGVFPAAPAPAHITVRSIQPAKLSLGHSLKRQSRSLGAQRWAFRLRFAPMTSAQFAPIWAHVVAQRGRYGTFTWQMPSRAWPLRGAGGGTPLVNNQAGSPEELQTGSRAPVTNGWTAGSTPLKAGDWVQFAGHTKAYLMTADATADGGGAATLAIEPGLLAGPAHGAAITIGPSVVFTCALAMDEHDFTARPRGGNLALYGFELDMVEAY